MTEPAPVAAPEIDPGGLGVGVSVLVLVAGTAIAAVAETMLRGSLGYVTGAAFVLMCVLIAALIKFRDLSVAIITPPLAYFFAILLAGQRDLLQGSTDHLWVREIAMVVTALAANAPWIFAGTLAAALIVMIRRFVVRR